jgi:hypothetical protein
MLGREMSKLTVWLCNVAVGWSKFELFWHMN